MKPIKLIVGLANPGTQYAETRHNAGAWFVENLAKRYNQSLQKNSKFLGYTAQIKIVDHEIRLLIPITFMNLSGNAVKAMTNFYHFLTEEILVVHDELDFLPGVAKFKFGGGNGGHNGLKDIQKKLDNNANFHRLRIGIGHPGERSKVMGFVLSPPPLSEKKRIDDVIDESLRCTELIFKENMATAIQNLHSFRINK
ncbi:peptidyl-tRNA hydrolase [Candidatus Regiella insecticola 5.15]|uniref:Peptidyl-tRNA hydrolase n=1 Tax=Candidatus Regiella insecticola 5.15 TaxID=1005043 RepID=G2GWJ2_9ENTR|nr:aminoacyl-tRNA hydrolase [Candidatus Regiella insecticola]EGY29892.1 peptidyl-tRNA hydrolase [Candidatus Regiella insecticola 5.15]